jgi:hypothetical protein
MFLSWDDLLFLIAINIWDKCRKNVHEIILYDITASSFIPYSQTFKRVVAVAMCIVLIVN